MRCGRTNWGRIVNIGAIDASVERADARGHADVKLISHRFSDQSKRLAILVGSGTGAVIRRRLLGCVRVSPSVPV